MHESAERPESVNVPSPGAARPRSRIAWACLAAGVLLCGLPGCSRPFWRLNADANAYGIINEKTTDPRWEFPRISVQPDARSRFFDPYDPDKEPLPPDDASAHEYMHWAYGMRGYKGWHQYGDLISVENPQWLEPFGLSPTGILEPGPDGPPPGIPNLTLEQAIELSYIHSRDFQLQLENLYVTALALTFDRFRFNLRYLGFGGLPPTSDTFYSVTPGVQQSISSHNRIGVSQLLPTGAQYIVELSNNTLWLFSGPNKTSTASLLSFSLVQPLLQGAGRKVNLEALTQSERNVLYAARNFARFRQQFFVSTVAGGATTSTAVGTSAAAQANTTVATATGTITTGAVGTTGGAGAGGSNGYLGLLQLQQQVDNTYNNILAFEDQLLRLQALANNPEGILSVPLPVLPEGLQLPDRLGELPPGVKLPEIIEGRIRYNERLKQLRWQGDMTNEQLQTLLGLNATPAYQSAVRELFSLSSQSQTLTLTISQLATQLYGNRTQYLTNSKNFQDAMDRYKIQLGLPTDFPVTLDVTMLKPFQLIDPRLTQLQAKINAFVSVWAQLDEADIDQDQLRAVLGEFQRLENQVQRDGLDLVADDFRRVQENWPTRMAGLSTEADRLRVVDDVKRDRSVYESIRVNFLEAQAVLRRFNAMVNREKPLTPEEGVDLIRAIAELREKYLKIAQGLTVVQIGLRVELINLNPFDMDIDEATKLGLANRVDLMNQRATVMDARRKVEVAANTLQAILNLEVNGDISTKSIGMLNDRPFDFRGSQSTFNAGVSFTAPLDQVQKRNAYRASLIAYQQARRNYMAFEDSVKFDVRTAWRQINLTRQSFENTRRAVRLSALQYDQAVETSTAPLAPGASAGNSQGLNLIQALNSVVSNQNNLIQIWVNYEQSRLNIYRDMGIMEIDDRGVWTDDYYLRLTQGMGSSSPSVPAAAHAEIIPPQALLRPQELIDETLDPDQAELLREALRENRPPDDGLPGLARTTDRGRLGDDDREAVARR
jgi:hypothetical protein